MTFDEFKEAIRRKTGAQKHVDSLLKNTSYCTCLRACDRATKCFSILFCIAAWKETEEGFVFWDNIQEELLEEEDK